METPTPVDSTCLAELLSYIPDGHKTAFSGKLRLFDWTAMSFELKNSPACFQRITDFLSNRANPSQLKAYLDDLAVGSNSFEDMMGMLKKLFEKLS